MTGTAYWLTVAVLAGGTFLFRLAFLGLRRPPRLPLLLRRALDYVPPAVLAALVLPELVNFRDPDPAVVVAGLSTAAAAVLTRRDFLAIVFGFAAYLIAARVIG